MPQGAVQMEREKTSHRNLLHCLLGPRATPADAKLTNSFAEFAREYKRAQEFARCRRKNGAIPAQENRAKRAPK